MRRIRIFAAVLTAVCILSSIPLIASGPTAKASVNGDMLERGAKKAYVLYDNTNGLPTSEANAIAQTKDGFIWIGSYSGLIRYDGNSFYRFDSSTGVASVVSLYVDSSDRLWIGTNDSGLALYDKGRFTFFTKKDGLQSSSIRSITEDSSHDIIVGTTQGMAYVDSDNKLHQIDDSQINHEYIRQITADQNGHLYGLTISGDVFVFENKRVITYISRKDEAEGFASICPDPNHSGYIYIGTDKNHLLYGSATDDPEKFQSYDTGELNSINRLNIHKDRIFLCSDNGIGWFDNKMKFHTMKNIPLNNSIDDMIVDYEENYWFASSRQGVMKAVDDQFTDIFKMAGLDPMVVNSTCLYHDYLYIGTDTGLFLCDKNYRPVENALTKMLEDVRIRCLKRDTRDNLWICTYNGETGLLKYTSSGSITRYTDKDGLISNWIRSVTELSDGRIVVANSGGISFISDDKITESFGNNEGINNTEILTICEGPDGEIYLGSDGDGIYVLKDRHVSRISSADGLPSEVILRIRYDKPHELYWVITSNALVILRNGKAETVRHFPYSNNFDLIYDDNGNIWVLSSNGLYVVNGDELAENRDDIDYRHYDSTSGLPCVSTANSWSYLDEDGTLYLAGSTGVARVNINKIENDASDIHLTVPFVDIDDKRVYVDNSYVEIPTDAQRIVIYGYAPAYSLKNPKITYKLEGFDETETVTDKQDLQPVTYTNLSGGFYRFRISVLNPLTGAVENSFTIGLEKQRQWHEEIWFWIVMGVILIAVFLVFTRVVSSRRVARAERKTRLSQEFVDQTISAFAKLIDAKDRYTQGHSRRVAAYTEKLAIHLGFDEEEVRKYKNIALLHDIGKVAIPDDILNKPEGLTDEEYEIMKSHTARGRDILEEIKIEPDLALGAGYHHERFDGGGYPEGLHGDRIPAVAQLIAIADTFDAMYSTRPYRKQLPLSVVLDELRSIAGTQLNEEYVNAFLELAEAGEIVNLNNSDGKEQGENSEEQG